VFSVGLFPIIVLAYTYLARKEERQMTEKFGDEYRAYQRRVPMFIPRPAQWRQLFAGSGGLRDRQGERN
jgi:protein-S-isoprenylcysteine O-methyltransferase Ste14